MSLTLKVRGHEIEGIVKRDCPGSDPCGRHELSIGAKTDLHPDKPVITQADFEQVAKIFKGVIEKRLEKSSEPLIGKTVTAKYEGLGINFEIIKYS